MHLVEYMESSSSSSRDPLFCEHCGVTNPYGAERCFNCNQRLAEPTPTLGFSKLNVPPPPPQSSEVLAPPPSELLQPGRSEFLTPPPVTTSPALFGQPLTSGEVLGWGLAALALPPIGLILPIYWLTQKRAGALGCLITFLLLGVAIPLGFVGCVALLASIG